MDWPADPQSVKYYLQNNHIKLYIYFPVLFLCDQGIKHKFNTTLHENFSKHSNVVHLIPCISTNYDPHVFIKTHCGKFAILKKMYKTQQLL